MISLYTEAGWEIVTQRAHGLLAGEICARWRKEDQPEQWVETLMATAQHDDVFSEFERRPLITDLGGPINFKMTDFDESAAQEMLDRGITKSRFTALLHARHIHFTHGSDPKASNFLKTLGQLEEQWLSESEIKKTAVDQAYELLEFCDAFSLLICQRAIPPEHRRLEISKGPDAKSYYLYHLDNALAVTPWPFETDHFDIHYESRLIPKLKFSSDASFLKALKAADVKLNSIKISKPLRDKV